MTSDDHPATPGRLPLWGEVRTVRRLGAITLWENSCEPRTEIRPHAHEVLCLAMPVTGSAVERLGSRSIERGPGSFFIRSADQEHSFIVGPASSRGVNIAVDPSWVERLAINRRHLERTEACEARCVWTATRLLQQLRSWSAGSRLAVEGMILEIIGHIVTTRRYCDTWKPGWIARLEDILRAEVDSDHSVTELADRVGVDPLYLNRTWRRFRGYSLAQFTNRLRIERATRLIIEGNRSLSAVAAASGFSHVTRFSLLFHEFTGSTPAAFRAAFAR